MKDRLLAGFANQFGGTPRVLTRAPGRLEILGNHTDYNEGVVLSVAVNRATWVAAAPVPGRNCVVHDLRDNVSARFDLDHLDQHTRGDWANYIKGVAKEFAARGVAVPAFHAVMCSDIPMSSGMSSSAALEMSFCLAIQELAGSDLPWTELAVIGQTCENEYVGARTGLLDQFSSLRGKADHLVFSDFRSLEVSNVPIPAGTALVVANSMVKHDLTEQYNERRERCEEAVAELQKSAMPDIAALRDVTLADLEQHKDLLDHVTYRRAKHVVGEDERVFAGSKDLENGDIAAFGRRLTESHESSRLNFENSCDELDVLVEIGNSLPGCYGARLSGGGFGGISVHLVDAAQAEAYAQRLATAYASRVGRECQVMTCGAADGASLLPIE